MNKEGNDISLLCENYYDNIKNLIDEDDILSFLPSPDSDSFLGILKNVIKVLDEEINKTREEMALFAGDSNFKCFLENKLASLYQKKRICKSLIFENKNSSKSFNKKVRIKK